MHVKVVDDFAEFYYTEEDFLDAITSSTLEVSMADFILRDGMTIRDRKGTGGPPDYVLGIHLRDIRSIRQTIMEYGEDKLEEIIQMHAL